jgi:hypothetical protein
MMQAPYTTELLKEEDKSLRFALSSTFPASVIPSKKHCDLCRKQ